MAGYIPGHFFIPLAKINQNHFEKLYI